MLESNNPEATCRYCSVWHCPIWLTLIILTLRGHYGHAFSAVRVRELEPTTRLEFLDRYVAGLAEGKQ